MNSKKDSFNYTYSADEQQEIKAIREKYMPSDETEDRMTALRKLDAGVFEKATAFALILGIVGTLVLGSGMSIIMSDFGKALGLGGLTRMAAGISIGIVGIVLVSLAYPLHNRIVKKERKRIAPEIIRLTDELLK